MQYAVEFISELSANDAGDLLAMFADAEFADISDGVEWLHAAVANSLAAAAVRDRSGRLIGFIRALGDGVSDCYIQDVVVRSDHRGQGIGKALVIAMLEHLKARNIDWIGLIATPGNAEFYRRLGFEELTGFTPMRLKNSR